MKTHFISQFVKRGNSLNLSLVCTLLLLCLLGCNWAKITEGLKGDYFKTDAAQIAAAAVREKVGSTFKVLNVEIEPDKFSIQLQDPKNPKNVDEYKYAAGFVIGPEPVRLNGLNEDIEKSSFKFDEINFAAVQKLAAEAISKAQLEGGQIRRMTLNRGFVISDSGRAGNLGQANWTIEIEGARESATAAATPDGKLLGVDLSRTSRAANYTVLDTAELEKAQEAFRKNLGEKARVREIVIYEKELYVKIPDTENPQATDDFKYGINGLTKTGGIKTPIRMLPHEDYFSLDEVNLPDAADLISKARERIKLPNGAISSISVSRTKNGGEKDFKTIWRVSVRSGVKNGWVEYGTAGGEIAASVK